jgi:EAL domain-containing protein (putative c-di-GMP-specific phosphodiesterase class I)
MLNKVCRVIRELSPKYNFNAISINASAVEFSMPNLADELLNIIRSYEISPDKIRLELTESAIAKDSKAIKRNMNLLRNAGISFYLDDFGTGYSTVDRLLDLPFSTIKFDKALLYKSQDDDRMSDIITGLVSSLKKYELSTLVEGVESPEQTDYSISKGFEYIQGFHYARPVPIEQLGEYFTPKPKDSIR